MLSPHGVHGVHLESMGEGKVHAVIPVKGCKMLEIAKIIEIEQKLQYPCIHNFKSYHQ